MRIGFEDKMLSNKKLREELFIAFGLISVTILVLLGYIFPGVSSFFQQQGSFPVVIGIIFVIMMIGFTIILHIVEPILKISKEANKIASGDLSRQIQLQRRDELGELGEALNQIRQTIRSNVDELKNLSHKTNELNVEINHRLALFSNLMDISDKVAQSVPLGDVLDTVIKKCLTLKDVTGAYIILRDPASQEFRMHKMGGARMEDLVKKGTQSLKVRLGEGFLGKAVLRQDALHLGTSKGFNKEEEEFKGLLFLKSAIVLPISSKGHVYGLLIVGNEKEDFIFSQHVKEEMSLITKHMAIAVLNSLLTKQIEKFEMTDGLTGLFNNSFARNHLKAEIQQAINQQKPCSFVLLRVDHFAEYKMAFGHIEAEHVLIKIAGILKNERGSEDKAAKFDDHEFALILSGRNKKDSIQIAQDTIWKIQQEFANDPDPRRKLTVSAAVVENPIDGATADELILKSGVILTDVIERGGNQVGYEVMEDKRTG